ncbi:146_t:CDS:2, partial [Scutellospora calospora]
DRWRGRDLWDAYHSSLRDEPRKQCWGTGAFGGNQPDKKRAKNWNNTCSCTQIYINHPIVSGILNGTKNNVNETITGDAFNVKRNNQAEDNGECSKRTKIDQYFPAHTMISPPLLQETSEINVDSLDFNDVENSYSQELSLAECLYTDKEWSTMEWIWEKVPLLFFSWFILPIDMEILTIKSILDRKEDNLHNLWITISETPFA